MPQSNPEQVSGRFLGAPKREQKNLVPFAKLGLRRLLGIVDKKIDDKISSVSGGTVVVGGNVPTVPGVGGYPVTNLWVTPGGLLEVEYDDAGGASSSIQSSPGTGGYPVTNIWVNSLGKLQVEYDDGA